MTDSLPVSVVIPAYEAQSALPAAIASVRAQTAPPQEIIVVDDGSTEGTGDVARALGVTVLAQDNAGCGAARNLGIRSATQPWIALLDADDVWLPDKLATQWAALAQTHDDLCASGFAFVHPGGARGPNGVETNRGFRALGVAAGGSAPLHFSGEAAAHALAKGFFLLPSTMLFRRALVVERDEWFIERSEGTETDLYYLPEDAEWCLRILRWTGVCLVIRPLVEYAVVADSLSSHAGRMRYGDVRLGDRICARPEQYVKGAAAAFSAMRPRLMREATAAFLRKLEFESAASLAYEAYARRGGPLEVLFLGVARILRLPAFRPLVEIARAGWRRRKALPSLPRPASR